MIGALAGAFSSTGVFRGVDNGESLGPVCVMPDDGLDDCSSEAGTLTKLSLLVASKPSTIGVGRGFRNPRFKALRGDGGGFCFRVDLVGVVGCPLIISFPSRTIRSDFEGKNRELRIEVRLLAVCDLLLLDSSISACIG